MPRRWKIAGINFDHMHMGDLLRMASEHPDVDIVGVCHTDRAPMQPVMDRLGLSETIAFTDVDVLMEETQPDIAILCPSTAQHADWTERVAPHGAHILVEKPFAATLDQADRMIRAVQASGKMLAINWPLRWYPSHMTAKRLCDEGLIGEVTEVHYYDGNRGPLRHVMDKIEVAESDPAEKAKAWWYQKAAGGGSLLDYLGYGVTLGTWYQNGKEPIEVTAVVDEPAGLEVDEHSIVVCRYEMGLSKFETRWGTFTDPWDMQPQPKCGFVLVGKEGTISSYDYEETIRIQTRRRPAGYEVAVDEPAHPMRNPIEYFVDCIEREAPVEGPLDPTIARIGQQIVDSAVLSAQQKKTVPLVK